MPAVATTRLSKDSKSNSLKFPLLLCHVQRFCTLAARTEMVFRARFMLFAGLSRFQTAKPDILADEASSIVSKINCDK